MKKVFLGALSIITLSLIFHKQILAGLAGAFLRWRTGLEASLQVNAVGLDFLQVQDFRLGSSLSLSELVLKVGPRLWSPEVLRELKIRGKVLDPLPIMGIGSPGQASEGADCEQFKTARLDVDIKPLVLEGVPLGFALRGGPSGEFYRLNLEAQPLNPFHGIDRLHAKGDLVLRCKKVWSPVEGRLDLFLNRYARNSLVLDSLSLAARISSFKFEERAFHHEGHLRGHLRQDKMDSKIDLRITGDFKMSDAEIMGHTRFASSSPPFRIESESRGNYEFSRHSIHLQGARMAPLVEILRSQYPQLQSLKIQSGEWVGRAQIELAPDGLRGVLWSEIKSLSFLMDDWKIQDLNLDVKFPNLKEPLRLREGHVSLKRADLGLEVAQMELDFSLDGWGGVLIQDFKAEVEGAKVQVSEFKTDIEKTIWPRQEIEIKNLSLQRVLGLTYGESAEASGFLSGEIWTSSQGIPVIETGQLKSDSRGFVRIRPPGARPPRPEDLPVNPKEILDRYLYDFHYDELSLDLKSDTDYQVYMTLRALGRNPNYLNGKPLKLSINLEFNAAKALEAYGLTSGMSQRLAPFVKAGKK